MAHCGVIYKLTNKINGLLYVGKTKFTGEQRLKEHYKMGVQKLRGGKFSLDPIQEAVLEFGVEGFAVETLAKGTSPEELCRLEVEWIACLDSTNPVKGYNRTVGGDNGKKTQAISPERLQQMQRFIAQALTPEGKAKAAASRAARTPEKKKKISEKFSAVQLARTFTDEYRKSVGTRIREYWQSLTPEQRKAHIAKTHTSKRKWSYNNRAAFNKMMANRRALREVRFHSEEFSIPISTLILSCNGIDVEEHHLALS